MGLHPIKIAPKVESSVELGPDPRLGLIAAMSSLVEGGGKEVLVVEWIQK
jgi:hypothetical protein